MEEVVGMVAIAALVAFALVKAYASKILTQLRAECSRLIAHERHLRQQREHEETELEGSEARLEQFETDREGMSKEADNLSANIERVEAELHRAKGDDDVEDGSEGNPREEKESPDG
ncbi:MAG: hypothetical protein HOM68_26200 [Gemmatimonadetes bacterium]|nr:hypothetical protein [Gemmatimonadota bacterium]MBT5144880.1 hypothetical protein [Gemmatimonadota bacterium]MBT5589897.1 hypothetical protein [Gemmatimonadota bacterium]MBT5961318.1 hypothetical protein [Gemmatimonadota bacterium]MBT6631018.1 hypothetical protein [Gemmatimonadota bacterium]